MHTLRGVHYAQVTHMQILRISFNIIFSPENF